MSEMNTESLESALGQAFGATPVNAPVKQSARPPEPDEVDEPVAEVADEPDAELPPEEPEVKAEPEKEPEFEIEIEPGKAEVLPLARLKELAARGAKAGRGFEENARVREALQAQYQQQQIQAQFNQAAAQEYAKIQALEQQLQAFEHLSNPEIWDTDPFGALRLKEQRDQLREQRAAAIQSLQAKQQQFQSEFQQNTQRILAAENEALLAKVPAWRNAEKAKTEQGEIASALKDHYNFTPAELAGLIDHRMLLVARDAAAYRKLLANKDAKVKQAREAPATAKPGAAEAQPNGRVQTNRAIGKIRELGTKGNHKAQEALAAKLFGAAFK